jgi:hypothetical protein
MDLSALRTLALDFDASAHGVDATITRPAPDNTPIETTVIWHGAAFDEAQPFGSQLRRQDPRRVLRIRRDAVSALPRDTTIVAPEAPGGDDRIWKVEGLIQPLDQYYWHALVRAA